MGPLVVLLFVPHASSTTLSILRATLQLVPMCQTHQDLLASLATITYRAAHAMTDPRTSLGLRSNDSAYLPIVPRLRLAVTALLMTLRELSRLDRIDYNNFASQELKLIYAKRIKIMYSCNFRII